MNACKEKKKKNTQTPLSTLNTGTRSDRVTCSHASHLNAIPDRERERSLRL